MIEKYDSKELEAKYAEEWEKSGVYKYNPDIPRDKTFAIDTPPPTVSGHLHIGHIMSYSQADILARYQRMSGKNMFFPIGWDDNGLPTERRVQNYFGIRCDPSLRYDEKWKPEKNEKSDADEHTPVSRKNFIEACQTLIEQDEKVFENIFRRMGFSYDWQLKYSTISDLAIKTAQEAFINLYKTGNVKLIEAPTMWDTGLQSAVAQAEIEDREIPGFFHDIRFGVEGGGDFTIATTRPEFLPACIAVVAHPDDERYKHLIGKNAIVPLFGQKVRIYGDPHAEPEKGTGIMMVCTFGDNEDVKFWEEHNLPLRQIIGRDGKIIDAGFPAGNANFAKITGLSVKAAQKAVVEMLRESGDMVSEPRPITHSVKFYEKGHSPIEFIPSRQWFVSLMDKKEALKKNGNAVEWTPAHMAKRLENWIDGLNQNWAVSRQRFFGVPFPVWYKLDANGKPDFDNPLIAAKLPRDPLADAPDGFVESQRGRPNGFIGDPDVMDTWATSSLTPKIAESVAGADLGTFDARPQAHDIIRTWAFYTIAQSLLNDNRLPWKQAWISGFVLDPDRKKMSKSKGNVVVPDELVEKYGADAVRLWAASSKLGMDGIADEKVMEQKRKLVIKFFNAAKFVFGFTGETKSIVITPNDNPVDLAFWNKMTNAVLESKKCFDANDYTGALIATEQAFWDFCDNYLEIVKGRAYAGDESALKSLRYAVMVFCALFAPFMPFITEEVWQATRYNTDGKTSGQSKDGPAKFLHDERDPASVHKSLHPALWSDFKYKDLVWGEAADYDELCELVKLVRGKKTEANKSIKAPIKKLVISAGQFFRSAETDIKNVLNAETIVFDGREPLSELEWGE
ncbi:MAG: valine--tRNA ligase [Rickettsiales bacterium]|jgi:valyl-tRNA synthetase|nr:valine--tRNA ligase [Rickettsiales bacterium]